MNGTALKNKNSDSSKIESRPVNPIFCGKIWPYKRLNVVQQNYLLLSFWDFTTKVRLVLRIPGKAFGFRLFVSG